MMSERTPDPGSSAQKQQTRPNAARARMWRNLGSLRASTGNVLVAVLLAALGVAVVAQVRTTQEEGLVGLRQADLIQLLDDVTTRADNLEAEIIELEAVRADLLDDDSEAAGEAAQQRLDSYRILAGTAGATGPGVLIRVDDPDQVLAADDIMAMVQELRDAGAEAIQIGDVRVVTSTWFADDDSGALLVSGASVDAPYEIRAIGDAHTLSGAMAIPGGFNDVVRRSGGTVAIETPGSVVVDALHEPAEPRYAHPVPGDDD